MDLHNALELSLNFVKAHPELSCVMLFSWAFLETGALLGLILPAEKLLIMASLLVSNGTVSPVSFLLCGTAGTFLGYGVSFYLGKLFGEELFKKAKVNPETIEKTRQFVETKGEFSLIFGRFIPVVRAVLPVVIGAFHPGVKKFAVLNAVGAVLWIASYLLLGNLMGKAISFIISHGWTSGLAAAAAAAGVYFLWRRYGKNTKVL